MMMEKKPKAIILAGSNGAGKTTFAREFLVKEAKCPVFINADLIADGLSPFQPERAALQASRLTLAAMKEHLRRKESFAVETTLAAQGYIKKIPVWQQAGFSVKLIFLWLPNVELAVERVSLRVSQGGHAIPEHIIRRRYDSGLRNLELYKSLVDHWQVFNNAGESPVFLAEGIKK
jgi:predicted ABC-type ATPase